MKLKRANINKQRTNQSIEGICDAFLQGRPGDVFTFSSLCNERLGHLVGCHRDEENGRKRNDSVSSTDDEDDNDFIHVQSQVWDLDHFYTTLYSLIKLFGT